MTILKENIDDREEEIGKEKGKRGELNKSLIPDFNESF